MIEGACGVTTERDYLVVVLLSRPLYLRSYCH